MPVMEKPLPADMARYIPEDAPFSEEQRAWLNGFFAGLLSTPPAGQSLPSLPAATDPAFRNPMADGDAVDALSSAALRAAADVGAEQAFLDAAEVGGLYRRLGFVELGIVVHCRRPASS